MNKLYYIHYSLNILYPKMYSVMLFIVISIIYHIYAYLFYKCIYEEYVNFHDRTNVGVQMHINPLNNNHIYIPLDYKIYDLKHTIFKIIIYICGCIVPFAILRYLRLGTEINLLSYINVFSFIPFFVTFLLLVNLFHLIFVIGIFFLNIHTRFYKETKKLYIYLVQFGGCLDPYQSHKSKDPYIFTYLLNPINRLTYTKWSLILYRKIKSMNINYNKQKYFINKNISSLIIRFLTEFRLFIPFLYKIMIYIIIFFMIIFELYYNNFIIKKLFYILLILFYYKQIFNLIYFSWHNNIVFDKTLSLYYYKLSDLKNNQSLQMFYAICANSEDNDRLLYYLNTGLNLNQADAHRHQKEWPEYPYIYKSLANIIIQKIKQGMLYLRRFYYFLLKYTKVIKTHKLNNNKDTKINTDENEKNNSAKNE